MGESPAPCLTVARSFLKVQRPFSRNPRGGSDLLPSEVGKQMGETGGPGKQDVDSEDTEAQKHARVGGVRSGRKLEVVGRSGQRVVWGRSCECGRTRTGDSNPLFVNHHMPGRPVAFFYLISSSH